MSFSSRIDSLTKRIDNSPAFQYGLLAAITLLAVLLRFYKLGEWSFWFDEIFNINRSVNNFADLESTISSTLSHKFLPLSIIASGLTMNRLGISEWSARLVPAIIGIITVPILYFPVKKFLGWRVGLLAALFLAISTWHIYWSQNARFYTSLLLIYTLALFAFFYAIEKDRPLYILIGFLLFYFAVSERLFAAWLIPVFGLYLLVLAIGPFEKPVGFRPRNIGLLVLLPLLGIAFIEIFSLLTSGRLRLFTGEFLADLEFLFRWRSDDPFRLLGLIASNIGLPLMIFAFFSGVYLSLKKSRIGLLLLIAAVVPVALLLLLNPFVFTKDRYVFLTLAAWIILAAAGVKELLAQANEPGKLLASGVLALLIFSALFSDLTYYQVNNGYRRDWRGAFALIQPKAREDDEVVSFWPELGSYYLGKEIMPWQTTKLSTILNSGKRYWFVLDSETIYTNPEVKSWLEQNGELIEVKYLRTAEDLFLRIYLYDPG